MIDWDAVHQAVDEYLAMDEDERSLYHDEFLEEWEFEPEEEIAFWEIYDSEA